MDEPIRCVRRHPQVTWHPVGDAPEEVVILVDGDRPPAADGKKGSAEAGLRSFVLRGPLAIAWWSRLAGDDPTAFADVARENAAAYPERAAEANAACERFVLYLADAGLLQINREEDAAAVPPAERPGGIYPRPDGAPDALPVFPLPQALPDDLDPIPWLTPLDLETFLTEDLVALGTYVGGISNTSGVFPCGHQNGGQGDVASGPYCIPGSGYGYLNVGWFGVRCE